MGTCFCETGGYKQRWVCFRCRKAFKKPAEGDLPKDRRPAFYRCPECSEPMHNLGKEFEAPRRNRTQRTISETVAMTNHLLKVSQAFVQCVFDRITPDDLGRLVTLYGVRDKGNQDRSWPV